MITNFIKEVTKFYQEVYETDLAHLSLVELQRLQARFQCFYASPIFTQKTSEEEKLHNLLAYTVLNLYHHFCLKDKDCPYFFNFLNDADSCLESGASSSLHDILFQFLTDIPFNVSAIIERTTVVDNPISQVVFHADLDTYNYLYYYGENITKNQMQIVDYFNSISEEKLTSMANCTIDCFLRGMKHANIEASSKEYVMLFYPIGFEKLARKICMLLEGKWKVVLRLYGNKFDKQLSYNHRYDYQFYLSQNYTDSYLACFKKLLMEHQQTYEKYAGAIYIESFGENRFIPKNGDEVFEKDKELATLNSWFDTEYAILYEEYIRKNTSFTIISYPCPEIGKDFESIFDDTIFLNTLDNDKYEAIHQSIIDVLDTAKYVHITGKNGNKTNLTVALASLEDSKTQTLFENCCADVNVPVGEVFTSPKLNGTNGTLHVSEIYLDGWKFTDLFLQIKDGMITEYSCKNFPTDKENREYVNEHLLFDNKTLPMGEFAIGTNTYAYVMGNKYHINDKLDILIAEKTGPHFAFGDTCYSMDEETKVYNPDGKEIIAKDNEISLQRTVDSSKAYFGVHTDVTIPYYELGDIVAINGDVRIPIIQNGKFVLPGTEELNVEGM